jgi:hypothetical protein
MPGPSSYDTSVLQVVSDTVMSSTVWLGRILSSFFESLLRLQWPNFSSACLLSAADIDGVTWQWHSLLSSVVTEVCFTIICHCCRLWTVNWNVCARNHKPVLILKSSFRNLYINDWARQIKSSLYYYMSLTATPFMCPPSPVVPEYSVTRVVTGKTGATVVSRTIPKY